VDEELALITSFCVRGKELFGKVQMKAISAGILGHRGGMVSTLLMI